MKYLGVDWGLRKIGLAISEEGIFASPLGTITVGSLGNALNKVEEVIKTNQINMVVLGKPDGEWGERITCVGSKLRRKGIRVVLVDETLSTREAQLLMRELKLSRKVRRDENSMAAAVILQRYLDYQMILINNRRKKP